MSDTKIIFQFSSIKDSNQLKNILSQQVGVNAVKILTDELKVQTKVDSHQIQLQNLNDSLLKLGYHPQRITIAAV